MSVSSFFGLNTTLRGLLAHQRALDVTAHNISNASTEGYSRQQAVLAAAQPLDLPGVTRTGQMSMIGAGVDIEAFARVRDDFADLQYRAQNQALGQHQTTAEMLGTAELSLSEPSDQGIGQVLAKFWSAWDDLGNHPESPATRQALVNQSSLLAGRIQSLAGDLSAVRAEAASQYGLLTGPSGDVKALATEIASLNQAIVSAKQQGAEPNDLYDRRDVALDKLSGLAQISVTDTGNGSISVNFGDAAAPLVSDTTVNWPQTLTAPGGQLGALLKLADTSPAGTITGYLADLDAMAGQLISSVNAAHTATFFSGTNASTIAVAVTASTILAGPVSSPAGDNSIALNVSKLRGALADNSYANLVARIGGDVRTANQQEATTQALVTAASDRRQTASGVSMDEEMTNMVRFQRGYQASARAMSTMDEMLDTLINRTGRVGL
jgi:flagellar hook-associated protein 1 FlgK